MYIAGVCSVIYAHPTVHLMWSVQHDLNGLNPSLNVQKRHSSLGYLCFLICFQNGESASRVQHRFLNDQKGEIWVRFSKVILFLSSWSVYFCIVPDVTWRFLGYVENVIGRFSQARSFIKVNWNFFCRVWFAALFSIWKYASNAVKWELHFPWGNAIECMCMAIEGNGRFA